MQTRSATLGLTLVCLALSSAGLATGEPDSASGDRPGPSAGGGQEGHGPSLAESRCAACHGRDEARARPAGHLSAGFQRAHGELSRGAEDAGHGRACALCHRRQSCDACHKTTRPADHTALWRLRAHGLAAGWDREACKTCHESGACVRCHRTTRPLNHGAAWRATHGLAAADRLDARCTMCHSPGACARCHAGR
jgi:hypothetical protein